MGTAVPTQTNGSGTTDGFHTISSSVFDQLAELVDWADIMEPEGWSRVRPPTLPRWRHGDGRAEHIRSAPKY